MQYAVSVDRVSFADLNRHPLLPAALLRRIESSDPLLTSVTVEGAGWSIDASKWIGPRRVVILADALRLNTYITSLSLAGHKLGSDGLKTLMEGVTRLTGLFSLNLSSNNLTVDDGARLCCAAAAAGLTALQKLNLEGNGFDAASLVRCDEWAALRLPQPPDEVTRQGFDALIQYLLSEDKVATNSIRIFVVGESTVRCFTVYCCLLLIFLYPMLHSQQISLIFTLFYERWLAYCSCEFVDLSLPAQLTSCPTDGQDFACARAHVVFLHVRAYTSGRPNRWYRPLRSAVAGGQSAESKKNDFC
jgi:hypothetical protein